jgi:hypothetical protein
LYTKMFTLIFWSYYFSCEFVARQEECEINPKSSYRPFYSLPNYLMQTRYFMHYCHDIIHPSALLSLRRAFLRT